MEYIGIYNLEISGIIWNILFSSAQDPTKTVSACSAFAPKRPWLLQALDGSLELEEASNRCRSWREGYQVLPGTARYLKEVEPT